MNAPAVPLALALPLPGHRAVDLSLTIAEDLPCYWSTHQPFQHKTWTWFADRPNSSGSVYNRGGPYTTRWMAIDEHTGTHFDAPSHFVPPPGSGLPHAGPAGEISAERVPLEQLMGAAAVIDVSGLPLAAEGGVSTLFGSEVITAWERAHGRLEPAQVVLLRTGWDRRYLRGADGDGYLYDVVVTRKSPGWPAPDVSAIETLLDRGVRCVGIDAPSIGAAHDGAAVHVCGLSSGMVFVESLTGLGDLPARGAWFCFVPLRLEGGTGAPGRAFALVPAG
ncbi:cyclase family protein [Streptosporangium oxazolinicum]|uniref:Cyclase family protein n=1 Tax=Streptosporangium oxazolinicum TaxID=909287 RepID=A0ABP8AL76_9ACTN